MPNALLKEPKDPETFRFFKVALNDAGDLMNTAEMMELADDLHRQIRERRRVRFIAESRTWKEED